MSTNIIYYILHKILFIGLRAPISLLDVKDTGRENVHRFGSRWFSEPELEKHKYPSILDTVAFNDTPIWCTVNNGFS